MIFKTLLGDHRVSTTATNHNCHQSSSTLQKEFEETVALHMRAIGSKRREADPHWSRVIGSLSPEKNVSSEVTGNMRP